MCTKQNVNAWYVEDPTIYPEEFEGERMDCKCCRRRIGVNFNNNIEFNPHSHITHTECAGHITRRSAFGKQEFKAILLYLAEVSY